jgi:signal transduction histidine kinase
MASMETKEDEWLRFIDTLAHELKTPLTSIIAGAGLLAEELNPSVDDSIRRLIQTIIRNADTLEHRLAELLDIVKTGSGSLRLQPEPVDIRSLVQGVVLQVSPFIQAKNQNLSTEISEGLPIFSGDGPKLEQVLINLLNNASKFTPHGGRIIVRARPDSNGAVISVKDNGIGIAKNEHPRLFKPYSRIDADRQQHPGLGLGLALAKQVVELHGGRIWVESEPGAGSTFFFTLPRQPGGPSVR